MTDLTLKIEVDSQLKTAIEVIHFLTRVISQCPQGTTYLGIAAVREPEIFAKIRTLQ